MFLVSDILADTICAPATVPGTGAVSIIRVSGSEALAVTDKLVRFKRGNAVSATVGSVKFGEIDGVDEVLVSIFKAPHSYTGEDSVEICCHASRWIAGKIIELLCAEGCRIAEPGEFTRRAFVNGKMDLAQAEAVADLVSASSEAAHKLALNHLKGHYSSELKSLRDRMVKMSALLELELDFSEEEVEFASREELNLLLERTIAEVSRLTESFRLGNAIKNGVPVAIVGNVNAGKSTLLNAIVGDERAIVSPVAGTTRDTVEELFTLDGVQYRFIDTAGLRDTDDFVEKKGIERSFSALGKADIVIGVLDGTATLNECVKSALEIIGIISEGQDLVLVRNKVDSYDAILPEEFPSVDRSYGIFKMNYPAFGTYNVSPGKLTEKIAAETGYPASATENCKTIVWSVGKPGQVIDISAATGEGLDRLLSVISETSKARIGDDSADTMVTSLRHYESLRQAQNSLLNAKRGLNTSLPTDLIAEDLRAAISSLSSIFGEQISTDEVLGEIFGKFCIGK